MVLGWTSLVVLHLLLDLLALNGIILSVILVMIDSRGRTDYKVGSIDWMKDIDWLVNDDRSLHEFQCFIDPSVDYKARNN